MNIESSLIGQSPAIKKLRKDIITLSKQRDHVVLCGPTGVGKTAIAMAIHRSANGHGTLVRLDPLSTAEQEIKNVLDKPGSKISTLLVQDLEEFSFLHQSSISNFITRLGEKPALRLIMTSKKDITGLKKTGKLLPELFMEIRGFECLEIPPLSSRREDIPLLVEQFIRSSCESLGIKAKTIDVNALDFLVRREWKENIRELRSVIEHAVLSSAGETIDLPKYLVDELGQLEGIVANIQQKRPFAFDKSLSNLEKTLIEKALVATGYQQTEAAENLNISNANLRYRLRKFKILLPK